MKINLFVFTTAITLISVLFGAWLFFLNRLHDKQ